MPAGYAPAHRARLLAELVARRAAGETFKAIAATPGWPSRRTLRKWLRQAPHLAVARLRRPSVRWSRALALDICERFASHSLREISGQPGMPDRKTLHQWRRRHPWFDARLEAIRREARQPPTGRRSTYCDVVADDVAHAVLATGSLHAACQDPHFPSVRTVRDWTHAHPDFARDLRIAREMAYEIRMGPRIEAIRRLLDTPLPPPNPRRRPRKPKA